MAKIKAPVEKLPTGKKLAVTPVRGSEENKARIGSTGDANAMLPFDVPVSMIVSRYMGKSKPRKDLPQVPALLGWGMEFEFYGFGLAKLEVKIARDPEVLTIYLGGEEIGRLKKKARGI